MKTYIVYDPCGNEVGYLRTTGGQNVAEKKAIDRHGNRSSVSYTELGKEFDHCKGFFDEADAK